MLIPLWIFTLMSSLIVLLSILTYYLIGFLFLIAITENKRELELINDHCDELIANYSLYFWEKKIIQKLSYFINLAIGDEKLFKLTSSWPMIIVLSNLGGHIISRRISYLDSSQINNTKI
jgi:hypothetical protein